ncbi:hypothetical protein ACFQMM_18335 [Saliphagus sp. GCM10025308]
MTADTFGDDSDGEHDEDDGECDGGARNRTFLVDPRQQSRMDEDGLTLGDAPRIGIVADDVTGDSTRAAAPARSPAGTERRTRAQGQGLVNARRHSKTRSAHSTAISKSSPDRQTRFTTPLRTSSSRSVIAHSRRSPGSRTPSTRRSSPWRPAPGSLRWP